MSVPNVRRTADIALAVADAFLASHPSYRSLAEDLREEAVIVAFRQRDEAIDPTEGFKVADFRLIIERALVEHTILLCDIQRAPD